jgi:hypothetical protein
MRNTGKIFEFVNDIKEKFKNINSYISIYPDTDIESGNIKFLMKYKIPVERTGREIITDIKNSTRPQSFSKRRKLTRS